MNENHDRAINGALEFTLFCARFLEKDNEKSKKKRFFRHFLGFVICTERGQMHILHRGGTEQRPRAASNTRCLPIDRVIKTAANAANSAAHIMNRINSLWLAVPAITCYILLARGSEEAHTGRRARGKQIDQRSKCGKFNLFALIIRCTVLWSHSIRIEERHSQAHHMPGTLAQTLCPRHYTMGHCIALRGTAEYDRS